VKSRVTAVITATVLVAALLATTGCTRVRLQDDPATRTTTVSDPIPLQGATALSAEVSQGVGELTLRTSSETTGAVGTEFTYAPADWKPVVSSSIDASVATLSIRQPDGSNAPRFSDLRSVRNEWVVTLPTGIATDLTLTFGVGTSDVDLRGLDLRSLDLTTGVGDTKIDLSGPRATDMTARIQSGVGRLTVRLPKGVGVRVNVRDEGIGEFVADGFTEQGTNAYVNAAYGAAGPKIELDLVRGIGDVTLVLVD